jgi:hypothetical protein
MVTQFLTVGAQNVAPRWIAGENQRKLNIRARYALEHQHKLLDAKHLLSRKVIESVFPQITLIQPHASLDLSSV